MKTEEYRLRVILTAPMLGSQSTREVATEYIAKRVGITVPQADLDMLAADETLVDELERQTTVFYRDADGQPVMKAYQFKGFLKNAGLKLAGTDGLPKNLRAKISDYVFLSPDAVPIMAPAENGKCHVRAGFMIDYCERALRASTPQGERVALARSEMLPAGCWFEFGVTVIMCANEAYRVTEEVLRELLDYGFWHGCLQWRSGGMGRFRYELERE